MAKNFTHIDDTGFPYPDTINPYKYKNDFDYSQYDKTQMRITVCAVPWDVGLIHVGNAQIGGLGNVVYFETKEKRDAWLDSIENKYTWETEYREYHTGGHIKVPLPYEKAVLYNYVFVEYTKLPVDYAEGGKDRFFFFIRQCSSDAPSTCDIEILRDTFQTYIYDIHVKHLMLERGHAPMALIDADRYLSNPIENNDYLLADDVNYSTSYQRKYANSIALNSGDMWAVVVSSGNPQGQWGYKNNNTWQTPYGNRMQDGQPSYQAFAIAPGDLNTFLNNVDAQVPQFKQTIKAVFFIKRNLVSTSGNVFQFCGVDCRRIVQKTSTLNLIDLTKSQFGYGSKYENLAKLYTYPYAYLEITDENGDVSQLRIEETSGDLSLTVTTSLAYPWINIDGRLNGIGTGGATIEFSNVNAHSFTFNGDWYSHLYNWNIPTFAVMQSASTAYDYSTHFDRLQQAEENETAKSNAYDNASTNRQNADEQADTSKNVADANAVTAKANADASAATAKANADASAATVQSNADDSALTNRDNTIRSASTAKTNSDAIASTSKTNADANTNTAFGNAQRDALANRNKFTMERQDALAHLNLLTSGEVFPGYSGFIGESAWANITKISDDWDADWELEYYTLAVNLEQMAMTSTLNTLSGAASNVAAGAIGGLAAGPGGAGVGAVSGLVTSGISLATASASIPMAAGFTSDIGQAAINAGDAKVANAINYAQTMYNAQRSLEIGKYNADETWLTNIANLVRDTSINDATDSKTTALANAQRNYDTDTANNLRTYNTAVANANDTLNTEIANDLLSYNTAIASALRTYNTAIANALRTYETALANNDRNLVMAKNVNGRDYDTAIGIADRNKQTSDDAITNAIKQAALETPKEFGSFDNGENSTTRPQGVFCNIVTQSKDAIAQAGDYFLRFGYAVNRAWDFTTFNIMPKFTYWKASDMWVSGNNVPDAYLDEIRFFFLGGVCVWRNPEDIGNISIYDNVE